METLNYSRYRYASYTVHFATRRFSALYTCHPIIVSYILSLPGEARHSIECRPCPINDRRLEGILIVITRYCSGEKRARVSEQPFSQFNSRHRARPPNLIRFRRHRARIIAAASSASSSPSSFSTPHMTIPLHSTYILEYALPYFCSQVLVAGDR